MNWSARNFRTVFLRIALLLFFIAILIGYYYLLGQIREQSHERIEAAQKGGIQVISHMLDTVFREFISDLQIVRNADDLRLFTEALIDEKKDISNNPAGMRFDTERTHAEQLFIRIARQKQYILQVSFFSAAGRELIRIEQKEDTVHPVAHHELMSVPAPELREMLNSVSETISVSLLNDDASGVGSKTADKGRVRFALPVIEKNTQAGLLVIDYDFNYMLSFFSAYLQSLEQPISFGLLDQEGNWIVREQQSDEAIDISALRAERANIAAELPALAEHLRHSRSGSVIIDRTSYVYDTINPVPLDDFAEVSLYADLNESPEGYLTVISSYRVNDLADIAENELLKYPHVFTVIISMLCILAVYTIIAGYRSSSDRQNLQVTNFIADHTHDGVMITDDRMKIIYCNTSFERLSGYSRSELIGKSPNILSVSSQLSVDSLIGSSALQPQLSSSWEGEIWDQGKNGNYFLMHLIIKGLGNAGRNPLNYVGLYTHSSKMAYTLEDLSADTTDLSLEQKDFVPYALIQEKIDAGRSFWLMAVKIENYETLESQMQPGDSYLFASSVAVCMKEQLGSNAVIAAYSPDMYLCTYSFSSDSDDLDGIEGKMEYEADAVPEKLADSIQAACGDIRTVRAVPSVYIGVSRYPEHGASARELLFQARIALGVLLQEKKQHTAFYSREYFELLVREMTIVRSFLQALKQGELELYFQPKYGIQEHAVTGAEALIRWKNEELGSISPAEFIPLLEQHGLTPQLSRFVIEETVSFLSGQKTLLNRLSDKRKFSISVNLSAHDLLCQEIVPYMKQQLKTAGIPPEMISIEITERTIMENLKEVNAVLHNFAAAGIEVAIDDFGTGFSSLSYLQELHIDVLKIDKSFLDSYLHAHDSTLISAVVRMAHELGITAVAEGVEHEEQLQLLSSVQCDQYQGYLFSKPLSAHEFIAFLGNFVDQ